MNHLRGKWLQLSQVLFILSVVPLCTFHQPVSGSTLHETLPSPQDGEDFGEDSTEGSKETTSGTVLEEIVGVTHRLEPRGQATTQKDQLDTLDYEASSLTVSPPIQKQTDPTEAVNDITSSSDEVPHVRSQYPADLFSVDDRRRGWVILHIIGVVYMFISVAVVCNEFFVPALVVITEKLAISSDVTGATFMAAGTSAPKFFGTFIGFLLYGSHVSVGSIVGAAVFNILFVIGLSALFIREVLSLTWWPLFRDVSFYVFCLTLFIIFLLDNVIMWWESVLLVTSYILYAIFIKYNKQVEQVFKSKLHKRRDNVRVIYAEQEDKVCVPSEGLQDSKIAVPAVENYSDEVTEKGEEEERSDKPLSLKWPDTRCKQATYLLLLPIIFPLWLTMSDVRNQRSRKLFMVTFLVSILWITVFSYFMLWWTHVVAETITVPADIVIPLAAESYTLISSVIVVRNGLGDMAVCSSMGRNIFTITLCLPVPWLLLSSIHGLSPVPVSTGGLICALVLLLLPLLSFIISIASWKWKMRRVLGLTLLLLYGIFVVLCVMFHYRFILCPL